MTNEQLIEIISTQYPDASMKQGFQYLEVSISHDKMYELMQTLKSDSRLAFDYLICQTGVDYPQYCQVVYHIESTTHQHLIVVKVNTTNRENAELASVSDIWATAEFHENEIFDLLGIKFQNHPHLRRLFLDENWGYPLRKDFSDDIHVVER